MYTHVLHACVTLVTRTYPHVRDSVLCNTYAPGKHEDLTNCRKSVSLVSVGQLRSATEHHSHERTGHTMYELIAYDMNSHVSTLVTQGNDLDNVKALTPVKRWVKCNENGRIVRLEGLAAGSVVYTIRFNSIAGIRHYAA